MLYLLPALVAYAAFVLVPIVHAGVLSLFQWNGITDMSFVGLDNYRAILVDERLRASFVNAGLLVIFFSFLPIILGLFATGLLSRRSLPGLATFRAILFLPQVIAGVVIGLTWRWIYQVDGPINELLIRLGVITQGHAWLGDFDTALVAVGIIATWVTTGLTTVLFMSGVQRIPIDLYDAAKVDGAGPIREFLVITVPGLRREIVVAVALTVIIGLRAFDLIFVTTRGGPGRQTTVPAFEVYQRAFVTLEVGRASAVAMTLAVLVFAVALLVIGLGERREG